MNDRPRLMKSVAPLKWSLWLTLIVSLQAQAQTAESCEFSGIWFEPERAGDGYSVIANASGWVIYFLGFDNWGSNFWTISELVNPGQLEFGDSFRLPMLVAPMQAGGDFDHPIPPDSLEPWGTLWVTFDSCASGTFTLDAEDSWNFGRKVSNVVKLMGTVATEGAGREFRGPRD